MRSKVITLAILVAISSNWLVAQDYDDIYYDSSPKKAKVEKSNNQQQYGNQSYGTHQYDSYNNNYNTGSNIVNGRDVDEYNRRDNSNVDYSNSDSLAYYGNNDNNNGVSNYGYADDNAENYQYTQRIKTFYNPVVIVETTDPLDWAALNIIGSPYLGWNNWGWGYNSWYGWNSWYDWNIGFSPYWGYGYPYYGWGCGWNCHHGWYPSYGWGPDYGWGGGWYRPHYSDNGRRTIGARGTGYNRGTNMVPTTPGKRFNSSRGGNTYRGNTTNGNTYRGGTIDRNSSVNRNVVGRRPNYNGTTRSSTIPNGAVNINRENVYRGNIQQSKEEIKGIGNVQQNTRPAPSYNTRPSNNNNNNYQNHDSFRGNSFSSPSHSSGGSYGGGRGSSGGGGGSSRGGRR